MDAWRPQPRQQRLLLAVAALCASCTVALPGRGENCRLAFQGRGSCADDLMCRADPPGGSKDLCQDPIEEGGACKNSFEFGYSGCAVGLHCVDGACVKAKALGEECARYSECGMTARCGEDNKGDGDGATSGASCNPKRGTDDRCESDVWCQVGLICNDGSCGALAAIGQSCENFWDCASDFDCDTTSKLCVERGTAVPGEDPEVVTDGNPDDEPGSTAPTVTSTDTDNTANPGNSEDDGGSNMGAIIGGSSAAVGLAALAAIIGCSFFCAKTRREKGRGNGSNGSMTSSDVDDMENVLSRVHGVSPPVSNAGNRESWVDIMRPDPGPAPEMSP